MIQQIGRSIRVTKRTNREFDLHLKFYNHESFFCYSKIKNITQSIQLNNHTMSRSVFLISFRSIYFRCKKTLYVCLTWKQTNFFGEYEFWSHNELFFINVISIQVTFKHWDPKLLAKAPAWNHYRFVSNFIRNRYDWRCRLTCKLLTYQININRNKILWKSDFDRIGIRGINTKRACIWYIEHCKLIWISQGWFRNWRERFFLPQTIWQPQKTLCSEINADMSKWISK